MNIISLIALLPVFVLVGCGGGGGGGADSSSVVSISITPSTVNLEPGGVATFSANVTGSSNTSVTWRVVEAGGGAISSSGVYTAPTVPGVYHIKATSSADSSKSATATVSVFSSAAANLGIIPQSLNVAPGSPVTLVASREVTWTAVDAGVGALTFPSPYKCTFTAPNGPGTYRLRATAISEPTATAMAAITVVAPNGRIHTVRPAPAAGGSIEPYTIQTVNSGTSAVMTVTPLYGVMIGSVTGCEGTLYGNTYITGPVFSDCTVTASFTSPSDRGWHPYGNGLPEDEVVSVTVCPSNNRVIYLGTATRGVWKSTDAGANWYPINNGLVPEVQTVAVDPTNADIIYAGTSANGAFKSTNGGSSWSSINVNLPYWASFNNQLHPIHKLVVDPINPATIYAAVNLDLYVTKNGGASWNRLTPTNLYNVGTIRNIVIAPGNTNILYFRTYGRVYKSTNGGVSWLPVDNGLPTRPQTPGDATDLTIDVINNQMLYVSTAEGLYRTMDGGGSWAAVSQDTKIGGALAFAASGDRALYTGWGRAYKSLDGGTTWSDISTGLAIRGMASINALSVDPLNSNLVYAGTSRGFFRTVTGGD